MDFFQSFDSVPEETHFGPVVVEHTEASLGGETDLWRVGFLTDQEVAQVGGQSGCLGGGGGQEEVLPSIMRTKENIPVAFVLSD